MAWGKKTPHTDPVVVDDAVPPGMRIAGAWSWRILVVVGVVAVVIYLVTLFSEILIPFLIGIVVAALLVPLSNWMQRHHVPKWVAVIVSLVGGLAAVGALIWLVVDQIAAAYPSLRDRTLSQYDNIRDFVLGSGLGISQKDLNSYLNQATDWLQSNSGSILSGVASAGSSLTHILTGLFIVIFTVIFLLIDGKNVWRWTVRLFPKNARSAIDGAGVAGWTTLTSFIRVQIFVAFVDAVGIGIGAAILQLPLVVPIAVFVFLGSFIPVVGAIVTGFLAVFVALVFNGPVAAVIMLVVHPHRAAGRGTHPAAARHGQRRQGAPARRRPRGHRGLGPGGHRGRVLRRPAHRDRELDGHDDLERPLEDDGLRPRARGQAGGARRERQDEASPPDPEAAGAPR